MGMVRKKEWVWGWYGERGRKDLVVREREPMAGLGLVGVVAGLG